MPSESIRWSLLLTAPRSIFLLNNQFFLAIIINPMGLENSHTGKPPLEQYLIAAVEATDRLFALKASPKGLSIGFPKLDIYTQGLMPGQITVIASWSSPGKTTLAMNIAECVAAEQGLSVGYFSLQWSAAQLVQRLLFSRARVSQERFRNGFPEKDAINRIWVAYNDMLTRKIFIEDPAELGLQELQSAVRQLVEQHGVDLIIIDQLELMGAAWKAGENRGREIAEISSGIKSLSTEFNIPFVVLSGLKSGLEKQLPDLSPSLLDLEASTPIARFADVVCLLQRKDIYSPPSAEDIEDFMPEAVDGTKDRIHFVMRIAKNRNGWMGDVPLVFLSEIGRFESR